ncbi:Crp/Fnr family transcriptional regulator [Poritiphilus flavus]|uniref:Cyclic nucleotide-binding domain-containing protein n=1 Tax=Poritiphilus flavus TaxID=2697053 RepID=A0A6L9EHG8_9FLAO|nr:Crp/Fnr family transcriptional regulator [Poritiphilus flavus]NAS14092.1 cyclic nucleotide-binding domain-containing protein [Poritiphilus flavus]
MKKISIKKGEFLQKSGDLNTKVYHVQSGLLRSYIIDEKGKEHIFSFAPENWVIAGSLPPEVPADLYIDAIENSVVLVVNKDIRLEGKNAGALIRRIAVLQKRVIMLMSDSALKRYEHFIQTYPDIVKRVPQKMIASYLGITPEALSKVKNERNRNH